MNFKYCRFFILDFSNLRIFLTFFKKRGIAENVNFSVERTFNWKSLELLFCLCISSNNNQNVNVHQDPSHLVVIYKCLKQHCFLLTYPTYKFTNQDGRKDVCLDAQQDIQMRQNWIIKQIDLWSLKSN